jgi:hypothetical protein
VSELTKLTTRWRQSAQEALTEIHAVARTTTQPPMSLAKVIQAFRIDPKQIHFDVDEEEFY